MHLRLLLASFALASLITFATPAQAVSWGAVLGSTDGYLYTLNMSTNPPSVKGPFLQNKLGHAQRFSHTSLIVAPDGFTGMSIHTEEQMAYKISFLNPDEPELLGTIGSVIGQDGAFVNNNLAVVGATGSAQYTVLNLEQMSSDVFALPGADPYNACVTAVPGTNIVYFCDEFNDQLIYGEINSTTGFGGTELTLGPVVYPTNAEVSPDGAVLMVISSKGLGQSVTGFLLNASGRPTGESYAIEDLSPGGQSLAFSPNAQQMYRIASGTTPDTVEIFERVSPGVYALSTTQAPIKLLSDTGISFFLGFDTIEVSTDGKMLIAGNPAKIGPKGLTYSQDVSVVNLDTLEVTSADVNSVYPITLATFDYVESATP